MCNHVVSPEDSIELVTERILFNPNEAAILNCRASGGPNNTFLWYFNGEIIEQESTDILNRDEVEGGEYTCQVTNIAGSESGSVLLIGKTVLVYKNLFIISPILHAEAPHDVILSSNMKLNAPSIQSNVTLTCSNKGGPSNVYEWRKDGLTVKQIRL